MLEIIAVLLCVNLIVTVCLFLVVLRLRRVGSPGNVLGAGNSDAAYSMASTLRQDLSGQRSELAQMIDRSEGKLGSLLQSTQEAQARSFDALRDQFAYASHQSATMQTEFNASLEARFEALRRENETKLEKIRETVEEKLQGTLEKRLGDSFSLVSQRLEQVQKGLGEMQALASDVGGLKKVLTNVKNRGSWGEVQLERQLEDMLSPDQYERNVSIRPDSRDNVEFAIRLPGRLHDEQPVYLPIDSKFPQEDYERLLHVQESGDAEGIEISGRALENSIILQAKTIASKYIYPPYSTDFAIMYLPTEGLFAEVIRRPGLASKLQNERHILITGPTTLMSLLNSLQMGFRTLRIEKRTSDVWQVLGEAKTEFHKYALAWEKVSTQLSTVQNTVTEAGRRTRAVERKLRSIETSDGSETASTSDDLDEE